MRVYAASSDLFSPARLAKLPGQAVFSPGQASKTPRPGYFFPRPGYLFNLRLVPDFPSEATIEFAI